MPGGDSLIGKKVSHYRIIEKVGGGGMGVVYKAEDTRLHRFVALKFLSPVVGQDAHALARFQREAQAASGLNHPNICTIHDIGEQDGQSYIAMELLEGETLKERIGATPLPLEAFLNFSLQIAGALEAAHKNGIVHRDIKPSNIFVTTRGEIKLADFGLAKHLRLETLATEDAATLSESLTVRGQIVGTIAYMSPEQAQDKDVDARSDIFSFGAVMYEMGTGRQAFSGGPGAAVIAEILRGEPKPMRDFNPALPEEVQRIVSKSLEKDRADRYQTANDLMVDLRRLKRAQLGSSETATKTRAAAGSGWLRRKQIWITAIVGVALITFLAVALLLALNGPAPISGPLASEQITFSNDNKDAPLLTDGSRLYFQSDGHPVEMSVKGGPVAPVRASLSGMAISDISPDASELLTLKEDINDESGRGSLWTVPVLGGAPRRLGNQMARGASWSPDGRLIAYADLDSVLVGDGNGSNVKRIWDAHREVFGGLHFSPDSQRIRVTVAGNTDNDPSKIWEVNVDGSNPHPLALPWPDDATQQDGNWTPDGKHFFFTSYRDGLSGLYEIVQPRWFEFWKKPTAVRLMADQIDVRSATPSRDSSGLFVIGRIPGGAMQVYDSKQNRFVPFLGGLPASNLVVSPDKKWMAYSDYPRHFLWRSRLDGSDKLQLTDDYSFMPQWSPDSKSIAFSNLREIYMVSADGGTAEKLTAEGRGEISPSWWPGGKSIVFNDFPVPGRTNRLKVVDLATRKVSILPGSDGYFLASWSPDGQYMAAMSVNPARVALFSPKTATWKSLREFQTNFGFWAWSDDSKSLYFGVREPDPGAEAGIYQLTINGAKWQILSKYDGVILNSSPFEGFPCITPDGRVALMSDTSAVQIYSIKWNKLSDSH
jgi:serine/threonine protein kinase/Tol biopolymer transport system component